MRLKNKNGYVNAAFGPQTVVEIRPPPDGAAAGIPLYGALSAASWWTLLDSNQ
jgi:hypothetical protein